MRSPGGAEHATGITTWSSAWEIPHDRWAAATPKDFYFSLPFLETLQVSRVENAEYRYMELRDEGEPAGAAVLSRFTLALDLLAGDPRVRALRKVVPSLLDIPMICCGIPSSFGQHHVHVARQGQRPVMFDRIHREMERWANESGAGLLVWKELAPDQGMAEWARKRDYAVFPTLPDHVVTQLPGEISEFIGRLRSPYRRSYRRAISLVSAGHAGDIRLDIGPFRSEEVDPFYAGYRAVMDRTPVRLETYNEAFFRRLADRANGARLLKLSNGASGESVAALLLSGGDSLWFALVAKPRARYADALYTLLLQCVVLSAIQEGFNTVHLGQTSDYAKASVGARPRRLETFVRLRRPWKHRLLKTFGGLLFPETKTPTLRVFRDSAPRALSQLPIGD